MKLRRQQIDSISTKIADELSADGAIKCEDIDVLRALIHKEIVDDLTVEDKLNDEVRQILEEHSSQMRQGSIEFHKMFRLVKEKLAKERNITL